MIESVACPVAVCNIVGEEEEMAESDTDRVMDCDNELVMEIVRDDVALVDVVLALDAVGDPLTEVDSVEGVEVKALAVWSLESVAVTFLVEVGDVLREAVTTSVQLFDTEAVDDEDAVGQEVADTLGGALPVCNEEDIVVTEGDWEPVRESATVSDAIDTTVAVHVREEVTFRELDAVEETLVVSQKLLDCERLLDVVTVGVAVVQ